MRYVVVLDTGQDDEFIDVDHAATELEQLMHNALAAAGENALGWTVRPLSAHIDC